MIKDPSYPFIMYSSDEKFRMNDSEDNWETL